METHSLKLAALLLITNMTPIFSKATTNHSRIRRELNHADTMIFECIYEFFTHRRESFATFTPSLQHQIIRIVNDNLPEAMKQAPKIIGKTKLKETVSAILDSHFSIPSTAIFKDTLEQAINDRIATLCCQRGFEITQLPCSLTKECTRCIEHTIKACTKIMETHARNYVVQCELDEVIKQAIEPFCDRAQYIVINHHFKEFLSQLDLEQHTTPKTAHAKLPLKNSAEKSLHALSKLMKNRS